MEKYAKLMHLKSMHAWLSLLRVTLPLRLRFYPSLIKGNGRDDFIALKNHYEGVGFHAAVDTKAKDAISTICYSGEKF